MTVAVHGNTVNSILQCAGGNLLEFEQKFGSHLFFSTIAHPQADPHTSSGQEKDQLVSPELIFCDSHPIHKKKKKTVPV